MGHPFLFQVFSCLDIGSQQVKFERESIVSSTSMEFSKSLPTKFSPSFYVISLAQENNLLSFSQIIIQNYDV